LDQRRLRGEEVIKARVSLWRMTSEGTEAACRIWKKWTGSPADVDKHAMGLVNLAKKLPSHFPKDTGRGKFLDKLTRALPAIWDNPEGLRKPSSASRKKAKSSRGWQGTERRMKSSR
jgi:hypothetical protein